VNDLLATAGAITAIAAALAAIAQWVVRPMARTLKRLREFLDDWAGELGRPGVPARLGVMARIERIEHQVHPNSGGSLRDAVDATRSLLEEHLADDTAHHRGPAGHAAPHPPASLRS
jgi:hypothetical protein